MQDLIQALQIFLKYSNAKFPTICEHDILYVNVKPEAVSQEDIQSLKKLGFNVNENTNNFSSNRFGSC
jgi:hypothetical protein